MGGKKVATTVYLTPEQDSFLKQLHQQLKIPMAELIRQGVDLILEHHKDKLTGYKTQRLVRKEDER